MSGTIALCLVLLLLSSFCPSHQGATKRPANITAEHGVVATDHGQCSKIGSNVLRKGGNAVDAAVAAALCLGVISSASSGLGGGAFMLVRLANGTSIAYDMRETAPAAASQDMYAGNVTLKASGPLSIAVPGELAGLELAWKNHGKIQWKELVEPAARLAYNGFNISQYLHMEMTKTEPGIMADEGLRNMFTSNGSLLRSGDVCYNKQLARTLRKISRCGAEAFYNGPIGQRLVRDVRKAGGILTVKDLNDYKVKVREPVRFHVMGVEISSMPPPSSGGVSLALILNILAQYKHLDHVPDSLLSHREIEALKHAFAVRMNLADPDQEFSNITNVVNDMLSTDFAKKLKRTILDNTTFDPSHYGGKWNQIHDHGTSHISVVDEQRNAVSMTTSVNSYFGSTFLSRGTGIVLNNEMDDFSIPLVNSSGKDVPPPAPANFIVPGKRPLSSMTPTIVVKDRQLKAVVGASGGSFIFAAIAEVLMNFLVKGKDPLSCILVPRYYHQLIPNVVKYENWTVPTGEHFEVPAEIRNALKKKGHTLESVAGGTICQFIVQESKNNREKLIGVSDPRKGGYPVGF
ncbi:gamma-glutamyltranspeptidase 1 [Phtheirospermum japonicum]|uniref:Glutathione hydrolase n=1 Tax=Phtheirospermum japonicum TaxID=374723 RepID=A0A830BPU4_9LAMI|nr:gamma-glutamyltranspeptidase 1 [Phtheirospermum japonicum]